MQLGAIVKCCPNIYMEKCRERRDVSQVRNILLVDWSAENQVGNTEGSILWILFLSLSLSLRLYSSLLEVSLTLVTPTPIFILKSVIYDTDRCKGKNFYQPPLLCVIFFFFLFLIFSWCFFYFLVWIVFHDALGYTWDSCSLFPIDFAARVRLF